MHLGDLHLGKRVNGFSLLEDQRAVLAEIRDIVRERDVEAVLIAGDVYDRPTPPVHAVELADEFITDLVESGVRVFVIGGNHDSTARLAFASRITREKGLVIAKPYDGALEWFDLDDPAGKAPVRVHLLPFVTPLDVRRFFDDREVSTYDEAVAAVVEHAEMGPGANILVAHQLVLGSGEVTRSDSEQISIGGVDEVSASHFDGFDYVALGHLHAPQWVCGKDGSGTAVRYCGSPLKYSFSEVSQRKAATIVDVDADGAHVEEFPLHAVHDMRELSGTIDEMRAALEEDPSLSDCYMRAILTEPVVNAKAKLADLFPLIMRIEFDYASGESVAAPPAIENLEQADPTEVFASLFKSVNGRDMDEDESKALGAVLERMVAAERDEREGGAR